MLKLIISLANLPASTVQCLHIVVMSASLQMQITNQPSLCPLPCPPSEANDYATVTETRARYNGTMANEFVEIDGLIPYSVYSIQVRAYNTEGSILSTVRTVTMPPASELHSKNCICVLSS